MKITQEQQILEHLTMYGSISSWEAITKYRITRLASIIHQLRQTGMEIKSEHKTTAEGKNYALYTYAKCGQMSFV